MQDPGCTGACNCTSPFNCSNKFNVQPYVQQLSRSSYSHSTVSIKYLNPHITAAHCSQAFKTSGAMSRSSEAMRHRIRVINHFLWRPRPGSNFQGGRRFSTALGYIQSSTNALYRLYRSTVYHMLRKQSSNTSVSRKSCQYKFSIIQYLRCEIFFFFFFFFPFDLLMGEFSGGFSSKRSVLLHLLSPSGLGSATDFQSSIQ